MEKKPKEEPIDNYESDYKTNLTGPLLKNNSVGNITGVNYQSPANANVILPCSKKVRKRSYKEDDSANWVMALVDQNTYWGSGDGTQLPEDVLVLPFITEEKRRRKVPCPAKVPRKRSESPKVIVKVEENVDYKTNELRFSAASGTGGGTEPKENTCTRTRRGRRAPKEQGSPPATRLRRRVGK